MHRTAGRCHLDGHLRRRGSGRWLELDTRDAALAYLDTAERRTLADLLRGIRIHCRH
ncbi:hypothetical protein [Agrococcus jejuensis]|uniref:hypothetical protein n=1 Tax=Agrococcus jejuensis TaxID=399736 RepID=UPI0016430015|nr:hypothetical protein [Agrococcus jejuensis]